MSADVIELPCVTTLDLPVERILRKATEADLAGCVVVGYTQDGAMYFAGTYADGGTTLWLLEKAKLALLQVQGRDG